MTQWLIVIFSYLLGSIPTAYIAGRLVARRDIRHMGDANAGAGNAYRELGRNAGIIVFLVDAVKGSVVIFIAQAAALTQPMVMTTGLAAVIGHNWPVYLGFRGGRGVSTTIGIMWVLITVPMLIMTIPTLLLLVLTRKVTPTLAFLFIVVPFVEWWCKTPFTVIAYALGLNMLTGITTWFRTRPKRLKMA